MTPRPPIWPKVPPRFTAAVLASHSVIALALSALIYLVCLTGTVSVLVDELKLVEQPSPAAAAPRPGALNRAIAEVAAKAVPGSTIYALAPVTPRQRLSVSTNGPGGEQAFVADADGRVFPLRAPFTDFVTELHMTLTAPARWGSLIVG
ncbi:PepSY-associated TM helix domain-containing protein, partial [Phenylobacterium sp.]|uniref:PepSY-associated TM helix domain-containing protein n=1 Tax=Phenylobacterium sp. TaxID=1871053 RepID=UPI0025D3DC38